MLQPSSIVFVAIILGWVAYLLPQWVRRREVMGQSHGRDRNSEAMRLLSRRRSVTAGPSTTPILPDPLAARAPEIVADEPTTRSVPVVRSTPVAASAASGRASASAVAARRRARVLLVLAALLVISWGTALVVPAVSPVAWGCTVLLIADLVALVVTGRRRAVRRALADRDRRHQLVVRDDGRRTLAPVAVEPAPVAAQLVPAAAELAPSSSAPAPSSSVRTERASERVARELDAGTPPSGVWTPVPVPPPTYTLKATAPRPDPAPLDLPPAPAPRPGAPAAPVAAVVPVAEQANADFAEGLDLDAVLARRRAVND